jgi:hypothetical protein
MNSSLIAKSARIDLKALTEKAESPNLDAEYQPGFVYQLGVDKSEYEATRWYRLPADSGQDLAYLYETGPEGLRDICEALKWYTRASSGPESDFTSFDNRTAHTFKFTEARRRSPCAQDSNGGFCRVSHSAVPNVIEKCQT